MGRRSHGSLRDGQKEKTRQRLLDAAREVFAGKGYAAATVDDIARLAGASRSTYYLHFDSKRAAIGALMEGVNRETIDNFAALTAIDAPSVGDFAKCIERYTAIYARYRDVVRAWIEAEGSDIELRLESDGHLTTAADTVRDHLLRVSAGALAPDEARLRATLLLLQLERYGFFVVLRGWKIDRTAAAYQMASIWHATYRAPSLEGTR